MSISLFRARARQVHDAFPQRGRYRESRVDTRQSLKLESLETRALLTISAVGTITSVPAGADFNYTIQLTNTSAGSSSIGTFWFASTSVQQDYLATSPITVTAPLGWADAVTHQGAGDGYGIEFTTSNADFKPGDTLDFSFQTADTPQQIGGNSEFYPGIPAGTSVLYPQTPFASGVQFEVTSGITTPPPPPPPAPGGAALVAVTGVTFAHNRKHMVTQITVDFSGAVNVAEADSVGVYRLTVAGKRKSFTGKGTRQIPILSASFNAATNEVTLLPRKAFALTKAVQLVVNGTAPSGLEDALGRLIDGNHDDVAGGNAVAVLRHKGATLS
jgi:hypothetical protein